MTCCVPFLRVTLPASTSAKELKEKVKASAPKRKALDWEF
jgi:hypothetical protein